MTQLYLTPPHPCPYLPNKVERKLFAQLEGKEKVFNFDLLIESGFRRSQKIAYKPFCESCTECISTRVIVRDFTQSKTMQRIQRRNSDLSIELKDAVATPEQYELFRHYVKVRHDNSEMTDMKFTDYQAMIEETCVNTHIFEYRLFNSNTGLYDLVAVALSDMLYDGLSMVYSFFNPDLKKRSLGTFLILDHIKQTQNNQKKYVYLGYWVKDSVKMQYKTGFAPQEHLGFTGWSIYNRESL
jgi:leucyl-tRNA---protein transferase